MQSGKRWKVIASRLLVTVLAVTMVFTMMPSAGGGYTYAASESLQTMTPEVLVSGSAVIGGSDYTAENVGLERSYTRDELKALEGGTDIQYSAVKYQFPYTPVLYRATGVYLRSLLEGTAFDADNDVLKVIDNASDPWIITFDPDVTETTGEGKTFTGLNTPRYFFPGVIAGSAEDPEEVQPMLAWALNDSNSGDPETAGDEKDYLTLAVGQLDVEDRTNRGFSKNSTYVVAGDPLDEIVLTVGSKAYTRADILMMDFAEAAYTYQTSGGQATDSVRGVPMSVLLAGEEGDSTVEFEAADGYDTSSAKTTVQELIDGNYMLAYQVNGDGIYVKAKSNAPNPEGYGFLTMYGDGAKPSKMINKITVTTPSGIDFSKSPYKHITNGGEGGDGPYNIDAITGATLTVEGPGVKTSVPVSVRDLEGRNAGAVRANYTDKREGSNVTRTYEGIDLYYILHNMTNGDNGIKLTDLARRVLIKNRNRRTIAEFTVEQVEEAHKSETPILVAYGTSLTNGENIRPFVFNNASGADPDLGNEDGCIKLVYDKSSITDDINDDYILFGNMAYIYVAEAETPGYKHDKAPYQSPDISNYVLTVTGDKIGREVNYTVKQLENMVEYDEDGKPDNSGMGYRDEYSLANTNYWYVNEYEGVQLWKLLLLSGLDASLASDNETLVSSTATDGYASTDKFTIKQVADPDSFGFYEKNPLDQNDGTYTGNENIREGDDVSTGDKLYTGYPVLVAYGVNGYPYVEKATQEGYLSGLQNDGGPLRIISGKKNYTHANGSSQAKLLDKVIVGDDTYHYSTHQFHSDPVYTALAENELTVKILNGADADAPVLKEQAYRIGDIETKLYDGSLSRNQLKEAKIKTFYGLAKNGEIFSDLYEGMNLNYFLREVVELPGYKGTITFSDGTNELSLNLEDVLNTNNGSNPETGMTGLPPILAYGKNGAPMVNSKKAEDGYQDEIELSKGTEYKHSITVKNNGGPLAVLFPNTDSEVSGKSFSNVVSITVNLSADKYAHTSEPYNSFADYKVTIKGEGTRLGEAGKDFALSELEGKQTIAFTGDYSILKNGATVPSQTRYRGIDLYKLLSSTAVGLKSNADKVIITDKDNKSTEFTLSEIRKTYMNPVTGETDLPVILAYGIGKAGEADKENGKPLVISDTDEGYEEEFGNTGGPVRLAVGQTDAENVNSAKNIKYVKSIEVTASEMTSWNHNSAEIYKQYRNMPVQLLVTDKDNNELLNKTYTVGEIEDNTELVERIEANVTDVKTWEGINFWRWVKQEAAGIEGLADPVSVTVFSVDGANRPILANYHIDGLENGILDGGKYVPIILAYGIEGYPLVTGDKAHPQNGEGYDATAGNNGGPLRLITHNTQGDSLTYISKIVVVVGEGGSQPEETADFTIKGLKSGDVKMSVDDIKNLKNKTGDNIGQAEAEYVRKGVTKKVKGAYLKNILALNGVENENTVITLNTPDSFEESEKGASYNNISLKQAVEQQYFVAYQEFVDGEWKDIDDIIKNTDIHTNLRMYRNYCAANGLDNQNEWLDQCDNVNAVTLDVPDATAFKEYPTASGVRSTWMDKDNTIWVGTYGGGLYYKKAGESAFTRINTSSTPALKTDFTSAVAADAEGGIWVSQNASYTDPTGNQGVLYIKGNEATQYLAGTDPATIPNNYVQAIKVDTDGKVWFGSFGGLTIYNPAAGTWTTYSKADKNFPATSINTIVLDGMGGAWLGFYPDGSGTEEDPYTGGFCHIDKDGNVDKIKTETGVSAPMFAQIWVRNIAIDKKGTVWAVAAGTNLDDNVGGVVWKWQSGKEEPSRYTGKELFPDYLDGSNTTEVRVVAVDKDGSLWFGTSADGVLKVSNPKLNGNGTMTVDAQYAKETGSWSAANMNNVFSIDFWNDGTAYVGTASGLLVLGDEPQGGGDEPAVEPAGDATPETADLTITGDALSRDGYFSIRGIKNTDGIARVDATFSWKNSGGTEGSSVVQGATLENIINYIGLAEGAEIDTITAISTDERTAEYKASEITTADRDGNKAMFIWKEDGANAQKTIIGQFKEGEENKGRWAKDVVKIVVTKKTGGDEPAVDPATVTEEINELPSTVTTADKEAIEKARADYEALTEEEQKNLPAGTVEKLEAAEAKLEAAEIREAADSVKTLAESLLKATQGRYSSANYTASTYMAYERAYTAAQAVMSNPDATKDEIEAAMTALETAKAALVLKKANPMQVKKTTKLLKAKSLRKSKKTAKPVTVKNAVGKVTFKKVSGTKKLKINSKNGKVTVKKGTKKGTYRIKVRITAAGNDYYKAATKTVIVKVKVK